MTHPQETTDVTRAALRLANRGIPVFPLSGKLPLTDRGFHDATTDLDQVADWWIANPHANVGMPTGQASGIVVIDLDAPEAEQRITDAGLKLPETKRVTTGREGGGAHLYYRVPEDFPTRNSAGVKGWLGLRDVDVRGDGGYVVVPPSVHPDTGNVYTSSDDPIADAPSWLRYDPDERGRNRNPNAPRVSILERGRRSQARRDLPQWDTPVGTPYGLTALSRELALITEAEPGTRQTTLNNAAFIVGKFVGGGHLDAEYAAVALLEHAPVSGPPDPFPEQEAEDTIVRGMEAGMDKPEEAEASDWLTVTEYDEQARADRRTDGLRIYTLDELRDLPGTEWLVEGIMPTDGLGTIFGASGVGKSFAAISMALAMGTGEESWGGHRITDEVTTVYAAAEGGRGIAKRADAWLDYHGHQDTDRFRVVTQPINLLDRRAVSTLLREVERMPEAPGMIVVDTLARSMPGGEENSAQSMGEVVWACDLLRVETGATIVLVHHTGHGKDSSHRERGSSSLPAAMDVRWQVEPHRMVARKVKEEQPPAPINFTLRRHGRSLVFVPTTATESPHVEVELALEELGGKLVSFPVLQHRLSDGNPQGAGWVRGAVQAAVSSPTSPVAYDEQTQTFHLGEPGEECGHER